MRYKNLCEKYKITEEQIKQGIDIVSDNLGKICDVDALLAVTDLLVNGDVEYSGSEEND